MSSDRSRTSNRSGMYSIPTLLAQTYTVRVIKHGYITPQRPIVLTGNASLDFVLDRVRVVISGAVDEAPSCTSEKSGWSSLLAMLSSFHTGV